MARYRRTMLGTCCIPWNEDGMIAEGIFRDSIRILLAHGLRDLYVFGTAGEGYAVSEDLFDGVARIFVEEMIAADATPMVGVISLSLRTIQDRIERTARRGVRMFQISLPAWGALDDQELATFFDDVCGRFPECQFLHYNLPRAQRLVTPDEYAVLAARHPNLVATKNSTSDLGMIDGLLHQAGELRHFLTEQGYAYASLIGECGFLVSIASVSCIRSERRVCGPSSSGQAIGGEGPRSSPTPLGTRSMDHSSCICCLRGASGGAALCSEACQTAVGSTARNRDHVATARGGGWATARGGGWAILGGRPQRVGASQAGSGTQ